MAAAVGGWQLLLRMRTAFFQAGTSIVDAQASPTFPHFPPCVLGLKQSRMILVRLDPLPVHHTTKPVPHAQSC